MDELVELLIQRETIEGADFTDLVEQYEQRRSQAAVA
jgi:ATP-dependent Zn protease